MKDFGLMRWLLQNLDAPFRITNLPSQRLEEVQNVVIILTKVTIISLFTLVIPQVQGKVMILVVVEKSRQNPSFLVSVFNFLMTDLDSSVDMLQSQ